MRAYYLRHSAKYIGFGRVPDTLWPQRRLGWFTLDIFPDTISERIAKILKELGRKDDAQ